MSSGNADRRPRFPARWDSAEPARSLGRLRSVPTPAQPALHLASAAGKPTQADALHMRRGADPGRSTHPTLAGRSGESAELAGLRDLAGLGGLRGASGGAPRGASVGGVGLDSAAVRHAMVQRLAAQGLQHPAVLHALAQVPRHLFVDTALVAQAYEDTALPIGWEQTISKPSIVGRMVELLCGAPGAQADAKRPLKGRVLEIGTGCGYQAAVLAQVATEVYSIERVRGLHERARANVRALQLANLQLILGDGMLGYAAGGPYAAIISAAGGAELPQAWVDQLAVGGRLIAPTEVVDAQGRVQQALVVVDRSAHGLRRQVLEAVQFVPLKSGIESHGRL